MPLELLKESLFDICIGNATAEDIVDAVVKHMQDIGSNFDPVLKKQVLLGDLDEFFGAGFDGMYYVNISAIIQDDTLKVNTPLDTCRAIDHVLLGELTRAFSGDVDITSKQGPGWIKKLARLTLEYCRNPFPRE